MSIATIRRENESNEKLISRWKKKTQQAGLVKEIRSVRYFKRKDSRTKKREGAVVREDYRAKRKAAKFYS